MIGSMKQFSFVELPQINPMSELALSEKSKVEKPKVEITKPIQRNEGNVMKSTLQCVEDYLQNHFIKNFTNQAPLNFSPETVTRRRRGSRVIQSLQG